MLAENVFTFKRRKTFYRLKSYQYHYTTTTTLTSTTTQLSPRPLPPSLSPLPLPPPHLHLYLRFNTTTIKHRKMFSLENIFQKKKFRKKYLHLKFFSSKQTELKIVLGLHQFFSGHLFHIHFYFLWLVIVLLVCHSSEQSLLVSYQCHTRL